MPIVVDVKPKAEFDQWLAKRKEEAAKVKELTSKEWTKEELVARGDKVYHTICAARHQAEGQGMPPMFPALKGSKIVTGPKEHHLKWSSTACPAPPWRPSASSSTRSTWPR